MDEGAVITFDNGSRLREGTTDSGTGGNGGIAMVCSIDYELKWEAGRLYIMQQDGISIRVEYGGGEPMSDDDDTKGYSSGSRRVLDNGYAYKCVDATTDDAVWEGGCLYDLSDDKSIDITNRQLLTSGGDVAIDWQNGYIGDGASRIDFVSGALQAYDGAVFLSVLDYDNQALIDLTGAVSVNWDSRVLYQDSITPALSWSGGLISTNFPLETTNTLKCGNSTLSAAPTASAAGIGAQIIITDSSTTTIGDTVSDGGSSDVLVMSNGTNWKVIADLT